MTLKQYVDGLIHFLKENPEAKDLTAIHSSDDEGNNYTTVKYSPTLGKYNDNYFMDTEDNPDAVCIN
jgi:hypothetical protein